MKLFKVFRTSFAFYYISRPMFYSLLYRFCAIYLVLYLNGFCHTVANASDVLASQEESNSKITIEKPKNSDENIQPTQNKSEATESPKPVSSVTLLNNTDSSKNLNNNEQFFNTTASLPKWMLNIKEGALQRTGYVALGFMSIVMIFFVIRAVRLRQRRSKSRKYGLITSNVSDIEMEPLDRDDDEEEDTTIFDAQHKYSLQ